MLSFGLVSYERNRKIQLTQFKSTNKKRKFMQSKYNERNLIYIKGKKLTKQIKQKLKEKSKN